MGANWPPFFAMDLSFLTIDFAGVGRWFVAMFVSLYGLIVDLPSVISDPKIEDGRATMVTWMLALVAALLAYMAGRRRDAENMRHEHSAAFQSSYPLKESDFKELEERVFENHKKYTELTHQEIIDNKILIGSLLAYYENIAVNTSVGFLSEEYISKTNKFKIIASYISLSTVIQDIRIYREYKVNRYYGYLFLRLFFHEYRFFISPVEWLLGRKVFGLTNLLFYSEYRINFCLYKLWAVPVIEWWPQISGAPAGEAFHLKRSPLDCQWHFCRAHFWAVRGLVVGAAVLGVATTEMLGLTNYF